jgi:hypothetical protein
VKNCFEPLLFIHVYRYSMDSYLARNPKSARAVAAIVAEAESKNSSPANIAAGGDAVSEEEEAPISSRRGCSR